MTKRIFAVCWLLAYGVLPLGAQSPPQIDKNSQSAVAALRELAETIKQCPRALSSEKKWGKGPQDIERWYVGPPHDVIWDVMPSSSVRSPYVGYVEFSLPEEHWVPDEDRFLRSDAGLAYILATNAPSPPSGDRRPFRYEFDLGPEGLELTKSPIKQEGACWDNAVGKVQKVKAAVSPRVSNAPDKTLPTGASYDEVRNVDMTASGKALLQVCSFGENASLGDAQLAAGALCTGYLEGILSGLALASDQLEGKARSNFLNRMGSCPPSSVTVPDTQSIVLKYIKDNPDKSHLPPASLVVTALREAFPCEKR